jgi:hypothetical protein
MLRGTDENYGEISLESRLVLVWVDLAHLSHSNHKMHSVSMLSEKD